jgi:hypothetical protein
MTFNKTVWLIAILLSNIVYGEEEFKVGKYVVVDPGASHYKFNYDSNFRITSVYEVYGHGLSDTYVGGQIKKKICKDINSNVYWLVKINDTNRYFILKQVDLLLLDEEENKLTHLIKK